MNPFESLLNQINILRDWILLYFNQIIFSVIAVAIVLFVYFIVQKQITRLSKKEVIGLHFVQLATTIIKGLVVFSVLTIVIYQFGFTYGTVLGLLTTIGGTILGFATINTLANAIAGIIVMSSQPFRVGDRIQWNCNFADIGEIQLIYTKMVTLNNVVLSVPH